ncbi:KIR protein [Plasmodium knowlesi strain H]|uniref:KIR protein n=3 Tax=Plasmodium knowlesi TaxID=5850 RepID=A0A5K1UV07_PLAKH|nr:KIR protein [Plasmodium knowlesi strain H]OTN67887.1 KIR protein [Plasmodium knowlesi]CAA9986920.1 KIR protein [Plasmodium knowlesi strain H]SBO26510.1 KIR protein [Plasmodium knowlesi strain H]SBO28124.1 KIR protein [Plasmodium knowlesi strain H]VVS76394.1 KIR protein [Plasmodium knowlesi strain H]|eukprot:XP_002258167.1 KIR protein [Plasmodium knowlesi strain H]
MSTAPDLKNLPSKTKFYNKFDTGQYESGYSSVWPSDWENKLSGKLTEYPGPLNMKEKIMKAYCYGCKKKVEYGTQDGEQHLKDAPCRFFYYWLGNIFLQDGSGYNFSDLVDAIYQAFEGTTCANGCKVNYKDDIPRVMFKLRKMVHDFFYDYVTINTHANHYKTNEKEEYLKYLQIVGAACRLVGADCPGGKEDESGTYCYDFNKKYKKYCETELKELQEQLKTCLKPNPNPNQAGSSGSLSDAQQEGDDLNKWLPSKVTYDEIVRTTVSCGDDGKYTSGVKDVLKNHSELLNDADKVAQWFCYPHGKKDTLSGDDSPCYYLYYHVGNTFSRHFQNDTLFWSFMDKMREKLKDVVADESVCKIDLSHFKKDLFIWEKRVYDYYRDHDKIKEKLGEDDYSCSTELDQYLTEAAIGYNLIDIYCSGNTSKKGAYCSKFRNEYGKNKPEELLREKCTSQLAEERLELSKILSLIIDGESENVANAASLPTDTTFSFATGETDIKGIAATATSSGLALVGLPAIAYFLYKHTSLPFWLREQFGGRSNRISSSQRRARRSTGPDFSNFTEDVSTEVPTEYSSYLSTVYPLEESIEDNSTTYYEESPQSQPRRRGQQQGQRRRRGPPPPRRRERTDNEYRYGSGQNISYFRM